MTNNCCTLTDSSSRRTPRFLLANSCRPLRFLRFEANGLWSSIAVGMSSSGPLTCPLWTCHRVRACYRRTSLFSADYGREFRSSLRYHVNWNAHERPALLRIFDFGAVESDGRSSEVGLTQYGMYTYRV